jgi:hypothetical protein
LKNSLPPLTLKEDFFIFFEMLKAGMSKGRARKKTANWKKSGGMTKN